MGSFFRMIALHKAIFIHIYLPYQAWARCLYCELGPHVNWTCIPIYLSSYYDVTSSHPNTGPSFLGQGHLTAARSEHGSTGISVLKILGNILRNKGRRLAHFLICINIDYC